VIDRDNSNEILLFDDRLFQQLLSSESDSWKRLIPFETIRISLFWQRTIFLDFAEARSLLFFSVQQAGSTLVDLALRFELLALCAALAFVGAILLGAF
jgi:hypothetical protein